MCIRDSFYSTKDAGRGLGLSALLGILRAHHGALGMESIPGCLLYTSDAADERSSVDLGGRRIIKKKNTEERGGGER